MSQIFEDLAVEKEVRIRKRVAKVFNKRSEDFPSSRAYNDFLEMVEDMTFNLMNEVDVAETEARIAAYEMENKDSIAANQAKNMTEQRFRTYQSELEQQEKEHKREEYMNQLEEERKTKEQEKADLIAELASTNKSAAAILQARQGALKRPSSNNKSNGDMNSRLSMPSWITTAIDNDAEMRDLEAKNFDPFSLQYEYTTGFTVQTNYVDPSVDYINTSKQTRAGGYQAKFAHQRALTSAFTGLLCKPIE
ncbi:CDK-activating kinase assembly factor MAT1-domain-containing protein [Sporodiniella umbellata]|nr:CDK-activating kinase assembly factor MAT1-domain-containing protein [Sporodiniella umbellata]